MVAPTKQIDTQNHATQPRYSGNRAWLAATSDRNVSGGTCVDGTQAIALRESTLTKPKSQMLHC
ncbi:MAG: hypothetical protein AAF703_16140 [Cyanobacteria bacterium P01_D01_bin.105]